MKKNKKILKEAITNKEYRVALYDAVCGCPICSLRKGCNRQKYPEDNWKAYRTFQWRK